MYCIKCGHPAEDGNVFCGKCGAKLQEPLVISEDEESERNSSQEKNAAAKKLKPMLLIGAGAVVLVALVLIIMNFGAVKNWLLKSASSPEDLLLIAYKNYLSTASTPLMDKYEEMLTAVEDANFKNQSTIILKPGKQALDMACNTIYAGEGDVSWLSEVRLDVDLSIRNELQESAFTVGLGGQDIVSLNSITDSSNQKMYITIPELNPQSLIIDTNQNSGIGYANMAELCEALPSRQMLEQLAARYMGILLGGFSNVEKYSETLTLDGISQNVTVLEAYIDHADLLDVSDTLLKQIKDDENIKQILDDLNPWYNDLMEQSMTPYNGYFESGYEPVDLYEALIAAVEDALDELEDEFDTADPDNYLCLYTYLDNSNKIIGINLLISDMEEPLSILTVSEDGRYASQILVGNMQISGSGSVSDAFDGNFVLCVDNEKLFDIKAENVTQTAGMISFELSEAAREMFSEEMGLSNADKIVFGICFEDNGNDEQYTISIIIDDEPLFELFISGKTQNSAEIILPENAVQSDDENVAINWLTGCDFEKLFSNLSDAGLPEDFLNALLQEENDGGYSDD